MSDSKEPIRPDEFSVFYDNQQTRSTPGMDEARESSAGYSGSSAREFPPLYCSFCGVPNRITDAFCSKCGKPLARPAAPQISADPSGQPSSVIIIQNGTSDPGAAELSVQNGPAANGSKSSRTLLYAGIAAVLCLLVAGGLLISHANQSSGTQTTHTAQKTT